MKMRSRKSPNAIANNDQEITVLLLSNFTHNHKKIAIAPGKAIAIIKPLLN